MGAAGTPSVSQRTLSVNIKSTGFTSRKIQAVIQIDAPVKVVWDALTDYDHLHTFIPGLLQNKCLERRPDGCILFQQSAQDVALGVRFTAACKLDITEYPAGLPPELCADEDEHAYRTTFPCPPRGQRDGVVSDISFALIEGDFTEFKGIWRMQRGAGGEHSTVLQYAVFVRPMPWLPVGLIQHRIEKEIRANLEAVRTYAELVHLGVRKPARQVELEKEPKLAAQGAVAGYEGEILVEAGGGKGGSGSGGKSVGSHAIADDFFVDSEEEKEEVLEGGALVVVS